MYVYALPEFILCFTNKHFIAQRPSLQEQPNEFIQIMERIKNAVSQSDKEEVFTDLKKTPHMLTAFLKWQKNSSVLFNL